MVNLIFLVDHQRPNYNDITKSDLQLFSMKSRLYQSLYMHSHEVLIIILANSCLSYLSYFQLPMPVSHYDSK